MQLKYKPNSTNQYSHKIEFYSAMCVKYDEKTKFVLFFFINYAAKILLNHVWQHCYTLQVL